MTLSVLLAVMFLFTILKSFISNAFESCHLSSYSWFMLCFSALHHFLKTLNSFCNRLQFSLWACVSGMLPFSRGILLCFLFFHRILHGIWPWFENSQWGECFHPSGMVILLISSSQVHQLWPSCFFLVSLSQTPVPLQILAL